jgi:hypothetical protein
MTVTGKIQYYLSMATLLGAFLLILTCIAWLSYPYKTVEFYNSPFPTDRGIYNKMDSIQIYMEYERFTSVHTHAIYRFTDGITFTTAPAIINKTPGKFKGWVIPPIQVPSVLPHGKYYLDMYYTYEVNPIRSITVNVRTQEFEVR